ncbi:hypothetical protein K431DRAFT_278505 [Polychaeton citri CBS 116435]|uniref:DNA/RNA-binding protein Kin17 WH-like domain-containing protein n=1 Tax=Polychaeton citri CBS 116435 TaxID=1314669 RepID=A0A9P4PZH6_9PEZI|nr:hypothetical protein K431DRAFT_278505 [Polychaeton citri CBS 116435]
MPKAEVGSTKYIANKMKAKGLQRLRWYCQTCEKQCRDENGFKQHTMSEGHVRAMLLVGEDPRKYINEYSNQFMRDFVQLLRTAHGEKKVHMNNFYQEYIRDKDHIHMNSTKWPSLTEFAKHLGREGICKVEEGDRGLEIQYIDNSPDAVSRREDIRNREKRAKGDEEIEHRLLEQQIRNAKRKAEEDARYKQQMAEQLPENLPVEPPHVKLELGPISIQKPSSASVSPINISAATSPKEAPRQLQQQDTRTRTDSAEPSFEKPKMSLSGLSKAKPANPLMARSKNPLAAKKSAFAPEPEKKMSNAERIMKEEMERKRAMDERRGQGPKRQRVG